MNSVLESAVEMRAQQSWPDPSVALCEKFPLDPDLIFTKEETRFSHFDLYNVPSLCICLLYSFISCIVKLS